MTVRAWRIVAARHQADAFSGEGAKLYGGRWNSKGTAVVYASGSLALALLELLVHLPTPRLLAGYVSIPLEFPAEIVAALATDELPAGWNSRMPSPASQAVGDRWARALRSAVLQVPSAIVPAERNFLINPQHPDMRRILIGSAQPCAIDARLKH